MAQRQCYHCKEWVNEGEPHDCWTTTEEALTHDLSPDLQDAWERLRETAVGLGEQRVYASHNSIMFSRRVCYFFVRPKPRFLEVCVFLGRKVAAPQISRVGESARTKYFHMIKITHRDQVEAPITDWLAEAYAHAEQPSVRKASGATVSRVAGGRIRASRKTVRPRVRSAKKRAAKKTARKK